MKLCRRPVPILPSGPALYTVMVRGKKPLAPLCHTDRIVAGGFVLFQGTRSAPAGNLDRGGHVLDRGADWRFAPFETITRALKYWCRNPMLPGHHDTGDRRGAECSPHLPFPPPGIMKGWITMFWAPPAPELRRQDCNAGGTMPIWPPVGMSSGSRWSASFGIITGRLIGTWPLSVAKPAVNS